MVDSHEKVSASIDAAPLISVAKLAAGLILAGVVFLATIYCAQLLVLVLLEVGGYPLTLGIGAVVAVEMERGALHFVAGWRPGRIRLVLTGCPTIAAAILLHSRVHWTSWQAWGLALGSSLIAQALLLRFLAPPGEYNLDGRR